MSDDVFPMSSAPLGYRWPWYPYLEGSGTFIFENGLLTSVAMSDLRRGRVGVRRWARHHARKMWRN